MRRLAYFLATAIIFYAIGYEVRESRGPAGEPSSKSTNEFPRENGSSKNKTKQSAQRGGSTPLARQSEQSVKIAQQQRVVQELQNQLQAKQQILSDLNKNLAQTMQRSDDNSKLESLGTQLNEQNQKVTALEQQLGSSESSELGAQEAVQKEENKLNQEIELRQFSNQIQQQGQIVREARSQYEQMLSKNINTDRVTDLQNIYRDEQSRLQQMQQNYNRMLIETRVGADLQRNEQEEQKAGQKNLQQQYSQAQKTYSDLQSQYEKERAQKEQERNAVDDLTTRHHIAEQEAERLQIEYQRQKNFLDQMKSQ